MIFLCYRKKKKKNPQITAKLHQKKVYLRLIHTTGITSTIIQPVYLYF